MRTALSVILMMAGCAHPGFDRERPLLGLVVPEGAESWKSEIVAGFRAMAARWQYDVQVKTYSKPTPDAIIAAAASIPSVEGVPVCVVFTARDQVRPVLDKLGGQKRSVITIGEDDAMTPRAGHVGMSAERLAYIWKIRMTQLKPKRRRVLFVLGNEPLKMERVGGAVYSRSRLEKEFKVRFRTLDAVKEEDFSWADLVTPVGADAVLYCRSRAVGKLLPVSSSDETLTMVNRGEAPMAITPEYFQVGVRALQLARDIYIGGTTGKPIINIYYGEADKDSMRIYLDKRRKLPPGPGAVKKAEVEGNAARGIIR